MHRQVHRIVISTPSTLLGINCGRNLSRLAPVMPLSTQNLRILNYSSEARKIYFARRAL